MTISIARISIAWLSLRRSIAIMMSMSVIAMTMTIYIAGVSIAWVRLCRSLAIPMSISPMSISTMSISTITMTMAISIGDMSIARFSFSRSLAIAMSMAITIRTISTIVVAIAGLSYCIGFSFTLAIVSMPTKFSMPIRY